MRYRQGLAIKTPRGWVPVDEQVMIGWDKGGGGTSPVALGSELVPENAERCREMRRKSIGSGHKIAKKRDRAI